MVTQIVKFRSKMSDEQVIDVYNQRAPRYRALEGLVQKHYLKYEGGEHGAVYVWRSPEDLQQFRDSELRKTIATAYRVKGEPEITAAEVVMARRE